MRQHPASTCQAGRWLVKYGLEAGCLGPERGCRPVAKFSLHLELNGNAMDLIRFLAILGVLVALRYFVAGRGQAPDLAGPDDE